MPVDTPSSKGGARAITGARRYRAEELTFLKGVTRARP